MIVISLCTCLILPSIHTVHKYLGSLGLTIFIVLGCIFILLLCVYGIEIIMKTVSERVSLGLSGSIFILLIALFTTLYPYADNGSIGGGSDRDDALNIAASKLWETGYPYNSLTNLENPITPSPGAILLSLPFALLGNAAYQNFFWIVVSYFAAIKFLKDSRLALIFLAAVTMTPVTLIQLVTGGDLVTNTLYILVPIMLLLRSDTRDPKTLKKTIPLAVLLGIGLSSRANYLLLIPLLAGVFLFDKDWKTVLVYLIIPILTFLIVTVPFYLINPEGFSPMHTIEKLPSTSTIFPSAITIPVSALIITLLLFKTNLKSVDIWLLRNTCITQAYLVLLPTAIFTIQTKSPHFSLAEFGIPSLCFCVAVYLRYRSIDR